MLTGMYVAASKCGIFQVTPIPLIIIRCLTMTPRKDGKHVLIAGICIFICMILNFYTLYIMLYSRSAVVLFL